MSVRLWHVVVFIVLLAVFAAARAPASFFAPSQPGGFSYERAEGTIWKARFVNARLGDLPVSAIDWRLSLSSLLQGTLAAEVRFEGGAVRGDVALMANWQGDRRISTPSLEIEGAPLGEALRLNGLTRVRDLDILFENGACASASGAAESDVLVVNDQILQWRGPPLSGGAGCEGDNAAIALVGSSDADQARGVLVLRGNGDGQWRAELQSAMPEVAAVLAAAGFQRDAASGAMALTGDMRWVPF